MYGWEGRNFDDIARLCAKRDPLKNPIGCLTTGMAADEDRREVLQWFKHRAELSAYLWRMEPQRWGVRRGVLATLKSNTEPVFIRLDVMGPTEELREAHNALTRPYFEIAWWGEFDELRRVNSAWPAELRRRFLGVADDETPPPIADDRLQAFVEFLRERYLPPPVQFQP